MIPAEIAALRDEIDAAPIHPMTAGFLHARLTRADEAFRQHYIGGAQDIILEVRNALNDEKEHAR